MATGFITPHDYRFLLAHQRELLLQTRCNRSCVVPGAHIYWYKLAKGRALGYARDGEAGSWWGRILIGGRYRMRRLARADDLISDQQCDAVSFDEARIHAQRFFREIGSTRTSRQPCDYASRVLDAKPMGSGFTVQQAVQNYVCALDGRVTKNYFRDQCRIAHNFILPTLGSTPCDDLSVVQLRNWFAALWPVESSRPRLCPRELGGPIFSLNTQIEQRMRQRANRILQALKSMLNHAWLDGHICDARPWQRVRPYKNSGPSPRRALSRDEIRELIAVAPPDLRQLILGGLFTGCRVSELRAMRVRDVDLESGTVFVYATKTARARRVVLTLEGLEFFARLTRARDLDGLVFRRRRNSPWRQHDHTKLFREACLRACLHGRVVFHELRHTYATRLLMAGASPFVVADQLGHKDCRQIIETYGHVSGEHAIRQIRDLTPPLVLSHWAVERIRDKQAAQSRSLTKR